MICMVWAYELLISWLVQFIFSDWLICTVWAFWLVCQLWLIDLYTCICMEWSFWMICLIVWYVFSELLIWYELIGLFVLVYSSDSLVASGGEDRAAHIWDRRLGCGLARNTHEDVVNCVAFSPRWALRLVQSRVIWYELSDWSITEIRRWWLVWGTTIKSKSGYHGGEEENCAMPATVSFD